MGVLYRNVIPIIVLIAMTALIIYTGATGRFDSQGELVFELEAELEELEECQKDASQLQFDFQNIEKKQIQINAKLDAIIAKLDAIGVKLIQAEVAETLRIKR